MVRRRISPSSRLKPVLAVGGIDPSGHAGLFADARVFDRLGLSWKVATTAITTQSETQFHSWQAVPLSIFRAQLMAAGTKILGVKIGMLATPRHLAVLLDWLKKTKPRWIVWDPVLRASTGPALFRGSTRDPKFQALLSLCDVFTPNLPEAEAILDRPIRGLAEAKIAVRDLVPRGKQGTVVLKGGHAEDRKFATDLVFNGHQIRSLRARRRQGKRRGTGCTFAAALTAGLCRGQDPVAAAKFAKHYVLKMWDN